LWKEIKRRIKEEAEERNSDAIDEMKETTNNEMEQIKLCCG
jgi:hypothetical protein